MSTEFWSGRDRNGGGRLGERRRVDGTKMVFNQIRMRISGSDPVAPNAHLCTVTTGLPEMKLCLSRTELDREVSFDIVLQRDAERVLDVLQCMCRICANS